MVFTFHLLGIPHVETTYAESSCAYTQKVLKFAVMMRKYYPENKLIFYGSEDNDVEADEHVTLFTKRDLKKTYGDHDIKKDYYTFDANDHVNNKFNTLGSIEVVDRIESNNDIVLLFWGLGHKPIADAVDSHGIGICVEPGIGYDNSFRNFRVFESYAIFHYTMGIAKNMQPDMYDVVIPNYFNLDDFEYNDKPEDYFVYVGRLQNCKGADLCIDLAERLGFKLKLAGVGDVQRDLGYKRNATDEEKEAGYRELPDNVEIVGFVNIEERKKLLSNAKCMFLLSKYIEPFGGTIIESALSGTPVITYDHGVFPEIVLHGITGYRTRTLEQTIWAVNNIDNISRKKCRQWGENFSLEKVGRMYMEYFNQIMNLTKPHGWSELNPDRTELDWLYKKYPSIPVVSQKSSQQV